MSTHLCLTPADYRTVADACRPLELGADSFPLFQTSLAEALRDSAPELATRVAGFRPCQVRLLFDHLRAERGEAPSGQGRGRRDALTAEEWRATSQAAKAYLIPPGFPHIFRAFLAHSLRRVAPDLSRKLLGLNDRQIERLYARLKAPGKGRV